MLTIDKVIYNPPATIILWNDGTKTMSKCDKEDTYDKATGFVLCVLKKKYGNKTVKKMFDRYVYNIPQENTKGVVVVQPNGKGFRKPNVVKKRIRMHDKPNKYLEITVEPTRHETIYDDIFDIFDDFFR